MEGMFQQGTGHVLFIGFVQGIVLIQTSIHGRSIQTNCFVHVLNAGFIAKRVGRIGSGITRTRKFRHIGKPGTVRK